MTPWAAEDTSPGLNTAYGVWRIRPALRCREPGGNTIMDDGDACIDANVTGDRVLRVFWCHDSPRQQFSATGWY